MVKLLHNLALMLLIGSLIADDQPHIVPPKDSKIYIEEKIEPAQQPQIAVDPPHVVQPENIKIFIKEKVERVDPASIDSNANIVEAKPAEPRLDAASPRESLFQMLGINPLPKLFNFPDQTGSENGEQPVYRKLFIFRLFPKLREDQQESEQKLLGGGGDKDPDFIRLKIDDQIMPHHMMQGGHHHMMHGSEQMESNDDSHMMSMVTNKFSLHSMMQHIKNMFNFMDSQVRDQDSTDHLPFVYKTNDGGEAIIPDELDDESRMKERKNCMMLSFMRLKASIYYRTILHLLFFTGVLLFILSMVMITCRSFKKKRYSTLRYNAHNMDVASVDAELIKEKSKFGSVKSWYEITSDRSTLIHGPESSVVLIQAPPAYDQVIVGDSSKLVDDKADTKSLPPGYDLVNEKN